MFKEPLKGARTIAASPVAIAGKLYITEESGKTYVVKAGVEMEILQTNSLDDLFWASPAVAGDRLLLRGAKGLYCVKK